MSNIKQVIVVRTDLNMRKGKLAAQAAHASMKVFLDRGVWHEMNGEPFFFFRTWPEAREWIKGTFTKIVVGTESEESLLKLHQQARASMLPFALIEDAGFTEFHNIPTWTALAIGPARSEEIDKITGKCKLL